MDFKKSGVGIFIFLFVLIPIAYGAFIAFTPISFEDDPVKIRRATALIFVEGKEARYEIYIKNDSDRDLLGIKFTVVFYDKYWDFVTVREIEHSSLVSMETDSTKIELKKPDYGLEKAYNGIIAVTAILYRYDNIWKRSLDEAIKKYTEKIKK